MNLVDQIFEQAKAGSAQGASMIQPFEAGIQAGQQQQRINLANRQLAMEAAQIPLRMTQMSQQNQLQGLQLEQQLRAKQNYIDVTKAFTDLSGQVAPLLQSGSLDEARQTVTAAGVSNAAMLMDPRYASLDKTIDEMQRRKTDLQYRTMLGQARLGANDARMFAAMPPAARLKTLADEARANGDEDSADSYMTMANQALAIEQQKRNTEAARITAEQARTDASVKRTQVIQNRTDQLSRGLGQVDRVAMEHELKLIEDMPNSKMTTDAKQQAMESVHAKYTGRVKEQNQPAAGGSTAAPAAPRFRYDSATKSFVPQ